MRRFRVPPARAALLLLLFLSAGGTAARGQPADCATLSGPTQTMPLFLDLAGRPGVPAGVSGQIYADVPVSPSGGMACPAVVPPIRRGRALEGPAGGDPLAGPPAGNLLRGR